MKIKENIRLILKGELLYNKWLLISFALIVIMCYILRLVFSNLGIIGLLYGALYWSSVFYFISCYSVWRKESRNLMLALLPLNKVEIWEAKTIYYCLHLSILLINLVIYQLLFGKENSDILANSLNQTGIVFTAYFLHEIFDDKVSSKVDKGIFDSPLNFVILIAGTLITILIFGGILISFFDNTAFIPKRSIFYEINLISTLVLLILPLILFPISKKAFLKRSSYLNK